LTGFSRPLLKTAHFALYVRYTGVQYPARFSFLLGKKQARRAVTRNAIRRVAHALFCTQQRAFQGWDVRIRLYHRIDRTLFLSASSTLLKTACQHELQQLLVRARKHVSRHASPARDMARAGSVRPDQSGMG